MKSSILPLPGLIAVTLILFTGWACNLPTNRGADPTEIAHVAAVTAASPVPTTTPTASPVPTVTPSPEPSATEPPPTPFGCVEPTDSYTHEVISDGIILNGRTVAMLEQAQLLYGGSHEFLRAITQGSYNTGVDASFGTHDGGGAVDLSMRDLTNWHNILYEEAGQMIDALRRAGFAAWVRDVDVLYAGSPVHIHAVAIGDADLSPAAQDQLTGDVGYFRGYNGLPENPQPDAHGGPIVCPWMVEAGYRDLR